MMSIHVEMPEADQGILKVRRITESQAANIGTLRQRQYCDQAIAYVEAIRAKWEFNFIAEQFYWPTGRVWGV